MKENFLVEKSFKFAVRIVRLYKFLVEEKKEYILSKQILRSGTSILANIQEAQDAQSKKDFISKISISLKEARETVYWLNLLKETDYILKEQFESINLDIQEFIRLLVSSVKTPKKNLR